MTVARFRHIVYHSVRRRCTSDHPLSTPRVGAIMLPLAACVLLGCAAPIQYPRIVHEDPHRSVRLEARYGYGQAGPDLRFSHPVVLSEAQWGQILEQIQIRRRSWIVAIGAEDSGPGPAFRDDERTYLATQLSAAFASARPDEWVLFHLSRPDESGLQEVTTGGFFVEGARLHMVLGNYRLRVSMPHVAEHARRDPLRPSGDTFSALVAREGQEVRTYHDWHLAKPLLEHPLELVTELDARLDGPAARTTMGPASATPDISGVENETDLERQFRTLKRLRDRGLITEQEYRTKRSQLLDSL